MKKGLTQILAVLLAAAASMFMVSCFGGGEEETVSQINSGGASFPKHFYQNAFKAYEEETGIQVNYIPNGSGFGQSQLAQKLLHVAGSDAYLTEQNIKESFGGEKVLHVPTCIGAIAVVYNVPGVDNLKLSGQVISDMYTGKIKNWNDPKIAALNPGVTLPDLNVTLVARIGKSGTTKNFTLFLERSSKDFGKSFKASTWPYEEGMQKGKKNDGVGMNVKNIEGAIGYVELAYVKQIGLQSALIQNSQGQFIAPSLESASLAAAGDLPADTKHYIANSSAKGAYPVTAMTWLLFYKNQELTASKAEAKETMKLVWWMIHEGQNKKYLGDGYAPLPKKAVTLGEKIIKSATFEGKAIDFQ